MIVITGPGRSGTSFLANLYRRLGYDTGGGWDRKRRAGREHPDVVEVNELIAKELNVPLGPPFVDTLAQRWDLEDELAERYGDRLRGIAARLPVTKDPRFCWTLGVWARAKAPIEHVVLTLRRSDELQASSRQSGMSPEETTDNVNLERTSFIYRVGSAIMAAADANIPASLLWFPDYLADPEALYEQLAFPEVVPREEFLKAFNKTANLKDVHFGTVERT